jgi:5-methylcytosine-specific restriction endonuclease McrA
MSPMAAKRPCLTAGCPRFAEARGRCLTHATPHDVATRGQSGWSQRPSDPEGKRLRGRAWMRIRAEVLEGQPRCYVCHGGGGNDDQVDHVDGDVSNNEHGNLRRICRSCHDTKTRRQWGRGGK